MPSRNIRRLLWYSAWLVWLPVTGYGISTGNLLLVFVIGPPLFLVSLYFSLQLRRCTHCGFTIRSVSTTATHCMQCGAAYDSPQTGG